MSLYPNIEYLRKPFTQVYQQQDSNDIFATKRMIFFDRVVDYMIYRGDTFPEEWGEIIQVQLSGSEYICLRISFSNFQKYHDRYLDHIQKFGNFVQNN